MIAELGLAALIGALMLCLLLATSIRFHDIRQHRLTPGIFFCISLALYCLIYSFAASDFSVLTVYSNSHTEKPLLYKITGTWGNHEGSMLLWVWALAGLSFAYHWQNRAKLDQAYPRAVLGLLGVIIAGFLSFILFTSNPFARLYPPPWQGLGLNPLLQDIGLAIHPPLLYIGYVGFAIVSAQAVAILLVRGEVGSAFAQAMRPWALLAWGFLTFGIGMGSWWAYRELGWGGWWFWDPVENISLLPWLSGTALIHCLIVLSRRAVLQNWTLLLAIFTFTFSLLGTFLVRSGVLTSVHSFASDPARGLFILAFVSLITLYSLWLYAKRYPASTAPDFKPVSREGTILGNNLLLVVLCATVLLGIVYPLILQALKLPSVSVGAPYYEQVFIPVALALIALAGIGPILPWKQSSWVAIRRPVKLAAALFAVGGLVLIVSLKWDVGAWLAALAALLGIWMLAGSISYGLRLYRNSNVTLAQTGMLAAHVGLGMFVLAAAISTHFRATQEMVLAPGAVLEFAGYSIIAGELESLQERNYGVHRISLAFTSGHTKFTLYPESRFYPERGMETAEAAIHSTAGSDVYAAISPLPDPASTAATRQFALRLYYLPAMFWLWLGMALAGAGGLMASAGYFREAAVRLEKA